MGRKGCEAWWREVVGTRLRVGKRRPEETWKAKAELGVERGCLPGASEWRWGGCKRQSRWGSWWWRWAPSRFCSTNSRWRFSESREKWARTNSLATCTLATIGFGRLTLRTRRLRSMPRRRRAPKRKHTRIILYRKKMRARAACGYYTRLIGPLADCRALIILSPRTFRVACACSPSVASARIKRSSSVAGRTRRTQGGSAVRQALDDR